MKIPEIFHSTGTGKPFSHCVSCNKELLNSDNPYIIEKAIRQYLEYKTTDTIFEYAMCMDCYMKIDQSLSDESKHNLEN